MCFALDYSVTREFQWRWFAPATLLGAFIILIFLTLINVALTGYETITVFTEDYNASQTLWFYRFMPFLHLPGPLCDAHLFKVGDSFTTNNNFFDWSIELINKPNAGKSGLFYTGTPLTSCDVSAIYVNGDLHTWRIDFTVVIECKTDDTFQITAKTSYSVSFLPGIYQPIRAGVRVDNQGSLDSMGMVLDATIGMASIDMGYRAFNAFISSNYTTPVIYSLQANFDTCPMSLGGTAACALAAPNATIMYASVIYSNSTMLVHNGQFPASPTLNRKVLDDDTEQPFYNLLQAIHACVRVELGNPSQNNFILNPSFLNKSITPKFPSNRWKPDIVYQDYSTLYDLWANPPPSFKSYLPVNISGPATIQVVYPCRFQRRKSAGSFFVSVLVATLSMFSTAWALFMLIASFIAKRVDPVDGNRCNWHCSRHRTYVGPIQFEPLELRRADGEGARGMYMPV